MASPNVLSVRCLFKWFTDGKHWAFQNYSGVLAQFTKTYFVPNGRPFRNL